MIHWRVSEGEIEIKDKYQNESFENLKYVKKEIRKIKFIL